VAGWGEDCALEAVTDFAKTIDELARRIESALQEALDRALVAVQLGRPPVRCSATGSRRGRRGSAAIAAIVYFERKEPP
jgi:hypothetical protein